MSRIRSQVSIEFIIVFFIFMIFTSSVLLMYVMKNEEIKERRVLLETQAVLNEISFVINTAVIRGDGFSIEMQLPEYIFNSDYSVILNESWVYLSVPNYEISVFRSMFSDAITGNITKGGNIIKNIEGEIFVN